MKKKKKHLTIGIFGFGNMGQAIFKSLKASKDFKSSGFYIHSINTIRVKGAKCAASLLALIQKSDVIFLCIKPQDFKTLAAIKLKEKNKIFISIMAGIKTAEISRTTGSKKVIRTMPNLALRVGESMTGWHAGKKNFTSSELRLVNQLLNAFGQEIFLNDEKKIDALSAVSGCGPAYVFLFMDALIQAAVKLGFKKDEAKILVRQSVAGSLLYSQEEENLPLLIKRVTSKKGITEAALKSLGTDHFYKNWEKALKKAYERAGELSK